MAVTVSVAQSCGMCCSGRRLRKALDFKAEIRYGNCLGRKMRYSHFLLSRVSTVCSRSKHKFSEKLLNEADKYGSSIYDRSKLLNKVSVFMGYNRPHDFIENERFESQAAVDLKNDVTLACKRFRSIRLGSSPHVELYDECLSSLSVNKPVITPSNGELLQNSLNLVEWVDYDRSSQMCSSPYPMVDNVETFTVEEESSYSLPLSSHLLTLGTEGKSDDLVVKEGSPSSKEIDSQQNDAFVELFIDKTIRCVPGLSKRLYNQLESCGFHTIRKLLHHFPRSYADLQNAQVEIDDGQYLIFIGKVLSSRGIRASSSFSFLEVVVSCEIVAEETKRTSMEVTGDTDYGRKKIIYLHLKKFFSGTRFTYQPFLRSLEGKQTAGEIVCVSGKVRKMQANDHYEMREYTIDVLKDEKESSLRTRGRPYPIYPSKGGSNANFLRDTIARSLDVLPAGIDPIPEEVIQDLELPSLNNAYIGIHQPKNLEEADLARKRLIFDEFFYLQLGTLFQRLEGLGTQIEKNELLDKQRDHDLNSVYVEEWSSLTKNLLKSLPYSLTPSQLSAISEIILDLKRPVPMNRLLQGDVGCGKTVIAFLACMEVVSAGYQAAFMAPTELLAIQHYENLSSLLENVGEVGSKPSVALLTGSTPAKQSRMLRKDLQAGTISMVIGTHSLIADNLEFAALRIAVVDEQHRFGVIQRGRFSSKLYKTSLGSKMAEADLEKSSKSDIDMAPHILTMSATPIPRTLALALYGDTSLTQITDLPPGRIPVETYTFEGTEEGLETVYKMMLEELKVGGKVYLVYPVIEQSEQLPQLRAASAEFESISQRFHGYSCGLLHGRMKSDEKDEALRRFRYGDTHILLATMVIEIGVDVPDASMMVVMNAERFGIAQLHQLRGRVGRGERKSKCLLVSTGANSLSRLRVLEKSSDGFYLANMDLLIRGPGDLLGKKQSGHLPEFPVARLEKDCNMLQEAHGAALRVLGNSHNLERYPALKAELSMRQPLCILGD